MGKGEVEFSFGRILPDSSGMLTSHTYKHVHSTWIWYSKDNDGIYILQVSTLYCKPYFHRLRSAIWRQLHLNFFSVLTFLPIRLEEKFPKKRNIFYSTGKLEFVPFLNNFLFLHLTAPSVSLLSCFHRAICCCWDGPMETGEARGRDSNPGRADLLVETPTIRQPHLPFLFSF